MNEKFGMNSASKIEPETVESSSLKVIQIENSFF